MDQIEMGQTIKPPEMSQRDFSVPVRGINSFPSSLFQRSCMMKLHTSHCTTFVPTDFLSLRKKETFNKIMFFTLILFEPS